MPPRSVVLDANVLIPIYLTDLFLTAADAGLLEPHWTEEIFAEAERNALRLMPGTAPGIQRRFARMRTVFPAAMVTGYESLTRQMTNHVGDRHVLAAAVHAGVHVMTANRKHFPRSACASHGVEVWTPDAYLVDLDRARPADVVACVRRMADKRSRPALAPRDVAVALGSTVPRLSRRLLRPGRLP